MKLFGKSETETSFSKDIGMEFGLKKCVTVTIKME